LKRFFTPLFVLSLGIFSLRIGEFSDRRGSPHWPDHPS
jgi:hypothetical protein